MMASVNDDGEIRIWGPASKVTSLSGTRFFFESPEKKPKALNTFYSFVEYANGCA